MPAPEDLMLRSRDELLRVIAAQQRPLAQQERQIAELRATVAALQAEVERLKRARQHKACTALFGFGTADFYNAIKGDQSLLVGLSHFSRATVVGGGLPLMVDGEVIGGIGVGGGTVEQDIDCARAGLKVLDEK